jgi:hypothetical protein
MVVVVVAIFAICWCPIQVMYFHIHYSCVFFFVSYHIQHNAECTFYYVPEYEGCTAQKAALASNIARLETHS